jgi:hypothetical protein
MSADTASYERGLVIAKWLGRLEMIRASLTTSSGILDIYTDCCHAHAVVVASGKHDCSGDVFNRDVYVTRVGGFERVLQYLAECTGVSTVSTAGKSWTVA